MFFVASKICPVQIHAMQNRASQGMTYIKIFCDNGLHLLKKNPKEVAYNYVI